MSKKVKAIDYVIAPLEGLWWTDKQSQFTMENKDIMEVDLILLKPQLLKKLHNFI